MESNRWRRLKHRRWQWNVGVLSIQRICVVTLLRVIGLQAAFENQFDTAIHPATVTGMVGVLEGLAHAARRQSIGVNAMFNEVLTNGIGTTLGQTGVCRFLCLARVYDEAWLLASGALTPKYFGAVKACFSPISF